MMVVIVISGGTEKGREKLGFVPGVRRAVAEGGLPPSLPGTGLPL